MQSMRPRFARPGLRLLFVTLATALLFGCARESATPVKSPAPTAEPEAVAPPVDTTSLPKLHAILSDPDMPDADRVALLEHWNKIKVRWDGFLGDRSASGLFMLYPSKDAETGIEIFPPHGWTKLFADLNRLTPLRVTGTLDFNYNGIQLQATDIELTAISHPPAAKPASPN